MYKLRPYQEDAVEAALRAFEKNKPFILQAATGAGKSLMIAEICHRLNESVLILQPSKELLEQNYDKLISYGITDVAIYSASKRSKEIAKFTYATIGSIYKHPDLFNHFKYVVIDEAHGVNPKNISGMYTQFLKAIDCKKVCGLTATPYRITQKYEKDKKGFLYSTSVLKTLMRIGHPCFWSGGIVYKVETPELIDEGFLSPIDYYAPHVDLTDLKVNSTGADYTEHSLECFWDDRRLRALAETIQEIDGKCQRNLIFCGSIRQGEKACEMLNQYWLDAKMVTGETPAKEREQIVADFRAGKFKHLINVSCFTTGFDVPELDSIVLARPTMSLALYYQMVGRGVRLDPNRPDKRLKVYDLAGCMARLGRVETIRLTKNETGYQDQVVSDAGLMSDKPLFSFQVPGKAKLANSTDSAT